MIIYLVVTQVLYVFSLVIWFPLWILLMAGQGEPKLEWMILFTFVSMYPYLFLASAIVSWVFYRKKPMLSFFINLIPVYVVIGIRLYMVIRLN